MTASNTKLRITVDVYHSGERRPQAPFLLTLQGTTRALPDHPEAPLRNWSYWKSSPLQLIAVSPSQAAAELTRAGFVIQ